MGHLLFSASRSPTGRPRKWRPSCSSQRRRRPNYRALSRSEFWMLHSKRKEKGNSFQLDFHARILVSLSLRPDSDGADSARNRLD